MGANIIHEDDEFKVKIPWALHQALIRIQGEGELTFTEGCLKAAVLVDTRREQYKKNVKDEADRLGKSRYMGQLNKARTTVEDSGRKKGENHVRSNEDNFRVPCSVCGKYMHFSSKDKEWDAEKKALYPAFANWHHTACE